MVLPGFDGGIPRLVVFDIDGTLYDQRKLRVRMVGKLLGALLSGDMGIRDVRIIRCFRKVRETLAGYEGEDLVERQYAMTAGEMGCSEADVRELVRAWIMERPLESLASCRVPGVCRFFRLLRDRGVEIGVLSDYPFERKMQALGLDYGIGKCSSDPDVLAMKPSPRGLLRIMELAGVGPDDTLMIGDRDGLDGGCARNAGAAFLLRSRKLAGGSAFHTFEKLIADFGDET